MLQYKESLAAVTISEPVTANTVKIALGEILKKVSYKLCITDCSLSEVLIHTQAISYSDFSNWNPRTIKNSFSLYYIIVSFQY